MIDYHTLARQINEQLKSEKKRWQVDPATLSFDGKVIFGMARFGSRTKRIVIDEQHTTHILYTVEPNGKREVYTQVNMLN